MIAAEQQLSGVIRHDVVPLLSAYLLLVGMLLYHRRQRRRRGPQPEDPIRGWPPTYRGLVRFLVNTAVGGYLAFMAMILLYNVLLGGEDVRLIRDAVTGGAWLGLGVAVPALLLFGWLEARFGRQGRPRRGRTDHPAGG